MGRPAPNLKAAYAWLVIGLILGVLGCHRFYLRLYYSGVAMTAGFLVAVFLSFYEAVAFVNQYLSALLDASSGRLYGDIPDIHGLPALVAEAFLSPLPLSLAVVSGVWWCADAFMLRRLVEKSATPEAGDGPSVSV
jgi:TM2 domain-containing membrane protein YozV